MSQCSEPPCAAVGGGEIMLFGVRVKVDPMRKSVSMNNLSDYEPVINPNDPNNNNNNDAAEDGGAAGYATADDAVPLAPNSSRERKRGIPWTEEEHKLFLMGLQKVGRGDWRGISRTYVKTRTPTQVASHAQKYFLRRNNLNRRRRRSSLFDITTDSVTAMPIEEGKNHQEKQSPITSNVNGFSVVPCPVTVSPVLFSIQGVNPMESESPNYSSTAMVDLNSNEQVAIEASPLSLRLSLSSGHDHHQPSSSTRGSPFQMMPEALTMGIVS